ncbi:putative mitogen-activated protein kinase, putative,kinase [Trypanosoma rangeli]|uniref:cyclin-dependent kinase n=1 Tax=Trypanosoma rangeli TaxID=5698 RepID=A0A422NYI3_TRYRA|nr:putative mitogen-activated protein kinase, putative,kinase [Trypanosoma rangeli]RNF10547.1 putative mitogen-activated protein kinase, putative,kinase [Trypanosoma rangeli]|eukprot:RNF10547.1 putative mitogen-activated protein kinase, putative,kinase [Trypanosoma rangeli]
MEGYETLGVLGEGTYGVVVKARHRATGRIVAIKKYKQAEDDDHVRKTSLREVRVLKQLRHPNIISLLDVFRRDGRLYLVFEYVENTILQLIEDRRHGLSPDEVRRYTYQLLNGVDYCHAHNIIHRDVKPENILVSKGGILKLCDFGFARQLSSKGKYTDYVATRWYRAPELLVGDVSYGKAVDIWAIGCIFSELSDGQPLFPGDSDLDQLSLIMRSCGPVPDRMVDIFGRNAMYRRVAFPETPLEESLQRRFYKSKASWLEFLTACLHTDPAERPSCAALMNMPYFTEDNFRVEYDAELRALLTPYQTPVDAAAITCSTVVQPRASLLPSEVEESGDVVLPLIAMQPKGHEAEGGWPVVNKATSVGVSVGAGGHDNIPYHQLGTLWSHYLGTTVSGGGPSTGELPTIGTRQIQTHHTMATPIFNSGKDAAKLEHKGTQYSTLASPLQTLKVAGGTTHGTVHSHSPISQQGSKANGVTQGTLTLSLKNRKNQNFTVTKSDSSGGWKLSSLKKSIKFAYPMFPALPSGSSSPAPTAFTSTSSVALNALSVIRDANTNTVPNTTHNTHSNTVTTTTTTTVNTGTGEGPVGGTNNPTRHRKRQTKRTQALGSMLGSPPRVSGNTNSYQSVMGQKCSLHDVPSKR